MSHAVRQRLPHHRDDIGLEFERDLAQHTLEGEIREESEAFPHLLDQGLQLWAQATLGNRVVELEDGMPDVFDGGIQIRDRRVQLGGQPAVGDPTGGLQRQPSRVQPLNHVVVHVPRDPVAVLQHRGPRALPLRPSRLDGQPHLFAERRQHVHRLGRLQLVLQSPGQRDDPHLDLTDGDRDQGGGPVRGQRETRPQLSGQLALPHVPGLGDQQQRHAAGNQEPPPAAGEHLTDRSRYADRLPLAVPPVRPLHGLDHQAPGPVVDGDHGQLGVAQVPRSLHHPRQGGPFVPSLQEGLGQLTDRLGPLLVAAGSAEQLGVLDGHPGCRGQGDEDCLVVRVERVGLATTRDIQRPEALATHLDRDAQQRPGRSLHRGPALHDVDQRGAPGVRGYLLDRPVGDELDDLTGQFVQNPERAAPAATHLARRLHHPSQHGRHIQVRAHRHDGVQQA